MKILVPTDFSPSAQKALEYAVNFSKIIKAKLYLLNTYAVPHSGATMMVSIDDLLKQESIKNLSAEEKRLAEENPSLQIAIYSMPGVVDNAVKDFCIEHAIDYVIMGTTGASGWQGKIFGSNTANLIGSVKCPIIAIPYEGSANTPCNILITTDLKTKSNANVYDPVKKLAATLGSAIRFVHITSKNNTSDLRSLETQFGNDVDFVYEDSVEQGLEDYFEVNKVDLIVVVAKKHGFFESLFNPSVSKKLAKELTIPMMFLYQE